jgi:potassium-dependent mechanosensitive channel
MELLEHWLEKLSRVWTFELFGVGGHPLTAGMLVVGLAFLIFGYRLAGRLVQGIERRFLNRIEMDPSVRYLLHRMIYYFLLCSVALMTLRILQIPITAFAFIGGALAIGIGFGSQNIVNNFISGLILMIERPVRVGDYIDVEGAKGAVEVIGIRATHLRTAEGREVIIPNSFFLEKAVTNWTLTDDLVRCEVVAGVAYGSPLAEVREVLLSVCERHPDVQKDPMPKVLFMDFGDNALVFRTLFWTSQRAEKKGIEIESDLRFSIDEEFRRRGISMPFPQRDLHVNVRSPVRVEMGSRV